MRVAIGIVLVIVLFFFVPLRIKCKSVYNVFANKGYLSGYFYSLRLFLWKCKFVPIKIQVLTPKKKFFIYFYDFKNASNFGEMFFSEILRILKIKSFKIISNFGVKEHADLTCVGTALLKIMSGIIITKLSCNTQIGNKDIQNFPDYNNTKMIFGFSFSVSLNLFLILYCFIITIFKNLKRKG